MSALAREGIASRDGQPDAATPHGQGRRRRASRTRRAAVNQLERARTRSRAEELWERHGSSAYAIACVLLTDASAATRAVELAMADLARSTAGEAPADATRSMARQVYRHSQELSADTALTQPIPAAMAWVEHLSRLQRACLALCLFGGHTYREAAAVIEIAPATAATLLTTGLTELHRTIPRQVTPG